MQSIDASFVESMNSEGDNPLVRGSPLGICALSDWDPIEQVHYFSEGRRLLLGM